MLKFILIFVLCFSTKIFSQSADDLKSINCRIVEKIKTGELRLISEAELDTTSKNPDDYSFTANIADEKILKAYVQNVKTAYPNERFWVTLELQGQRLLRVIHIDMEIYLEQMIAEHNYILHCFLPFGKKNY
jgi:hypothetical protein